MELAKDTPTAEAENAPAHDPHHTGSGSAKSPGGKDAPPQSASDQSQSGEGYPGPRAAGESEKTGAKPNDAA